MPPLTKLVFDQVNVLGQNNKELETVRNLSKMMLISCLYAKKILNKIF